MRTKTSVPAIPVADAARDFQKVLKAVDRAGFVQLTKNGKARYHISKEESEAQVLSRLKASLREHKAGKTTVLRSLADLA
ncbi:MAG: hypothetical protein Q8R32_03740 [bacterium]|nr:hypothetical protein [bacterium]